MTQPVDPNALTVTVNGTTFGGWQRVRVTRGVERMPSDFEIASIKRGALTAGVALVINRGVLQLASSFTALAQLKRILERIPHVENVPKAL